MIVRLIKSQGRYHVLIQDDAGKLYHFRFKKKTDAEEYVKDNWQDKR